MTAVHPRPDLAAHAEAARMSQPELVAALRDLLGAKLVAYLGRVSETRAVRQRAEGTRTIADPEDVQRLRIAYRAARLISERDTPAVAQAWFQGPTRSSTTGRRHCYYATANSPISDPRYSTSPVNSPRWDEATYPSTIGALHGPSPPASGPPRFSIGSGRRRVRGVGRRGSTPPTAASPVGGMTQTGCGAPCTAPTPLTCYLEVVGSRNPARN